MHGQTVSYVISGISSPNRVVEIGVSFLYNSFMNEQRDTEKKSFGFRRFLWWFVVVWFVAGVGVLAVAVLRGGLDRLTWKLLFTCIGLAVGAMLMAIQNGALPKRSKTVILGAVVIAISQVCFFLLVWSGWKQYSLLWRFWWVSMVPSVFLTHILLLRSAALGHRGRVERATVWCVWGAGVLLLLLGFRYDFFAPLHPVYIVVLAVPALGTVSGSMYVAFRWVLGRVGADRLSKRVLAGGMMMSHLLLLVLGFYIGRATVGSDKTHPDAFVKGVPGQVQEKVEKDIYEGQSKVATWLGDTRLVSRPPFISVEQIRRVSEQIEPGDIILERRNWYLSNPWLPGFWPHAALYVGTEEDLRELGIVNHPSVRKHFEAYRKPDKYGHYYRVIEAVSDGVVLSTLEHSAHADYVVVLRPRVTEVERAAAIARAFGHLGKPYDFNFDFDDRERLVCTQLVYLSYEGVLGFDLKRIMGRRTLPANEIARKYVRERGAGGQLEFVLFLDVDPGEGRAFFVNEEAFCQSVDRPRALVER